LGFSWLQNWAREIKTSIFGSWDLVGSKNEIGFLEVYKQGFGGSQTALVIAQSGKWERFIHKRRWIEHTTINCPKLS